MHPIETYLNFKAPLIPLEFTKVKYIVIHHIEALEATPQQIHEWHIEKGWNGAGYNEYIRKNGQPYNMRGFNIGAQCHGYNSKSYGIALEGNFNVEKPTPYQIITLSERIDFLKTIFGDIPVKLHSELNPTDCAGKNFKLDLLGDIYKARLDILKEKGILNTVEYWHNKILKSQPVDTYYVGQVLHNMSEELRKI